jgi:coproporphyrinogen III oxidase-like Fe-S oxidoreductase
MERLMLGLRVREGVDLERLQRELGIEAIDPTSRKRVERRLKQGHLEQTDLRLRIPESCWLFADSIIRDVA